MAKDNLQLLNLAIREINPDATYQAGSVDNIIWMDGTTPISKSDIEAKITDIKAFVTHSPLKKQEVKKIARQYYKERATGEVCVKIHDEKLNSLVRSIQEIIKAKQVKNDA